MNILKHIPLGIIESHLLIKKSGDHQMPIDHHMQAVLKTRSLGNLSFKAFLAHHLSNSNLLLLLNWENGTKA